MKIKKKTIRFIIFTVAACGGLSAITLSYLKFSENIFPKEVEYKIDDLKLKTKIQAQITPLLKKTKKNTLTRSGFINEIAKILSEYDVLDSYSVRLGFDKKLIIRGIVQKPIYAVHIKNGDIYLIGSAMRIIEKNPSQTLLQNIPHIFLPELVMNQETKLNMDFAWFFAQINLINNNLQWYNHHIEKIVWTNPIGFTINLSSVDADSHTPLVVYLGHKDIDIKIEKLKIVATIAKQKNIKPRLIDVDLAEKIFLK